MSDRDDHLWREGDQEPEPDWAEQIRAARKARGDKLRGVFASFDEDDPASPLPAKKPPPAELYDHEQEPHP
jgi:hypothetical protein